MFSSRQNYPITFKLFNLLSNFVTGVLGGNTHGPACFRKIGMTSYIPARGCFYKNSLKNSVKMDRGFWIFVALV